MATSVKQDTNIETSKLFQVADEYDLAEIKKMTSLTFLNECKVPIFQWSIRKLMCNSENDSPNFLFNYNQNNGQLRLKYNAVNFVITMTLDDYGRKQVQSAIRNSGSSSSYFVIKYKHNFHKDNSLVDEGFCQQIIVFGSDQSKASVSWSCNRNGRFVRSILIDVYRVSAAIPNFFIAPNNNNLIVGKIERFSHARKPYNGLNGQACFLFGSTEQKMEVMFFTNKIFREYRDGGPAFMAMLNIVDERENPGPVVPELITFTIFSEQKEKVNDLVHKSVIYRREKMISYNVLLGFFQELDEMLVNDILYYKIVLEPLNSKHLVDHSVDNCCIREIAREKRTMETPNQLLAVAADQFDLDEVKRMTNLKLFDECEVPIFQWRIIVHRFPIQSQLFPVNDNQSIGQLGLCFSEYRNWTLTMTLTDYGEKEEDMNRSGTRSSSYFIVKAYNYNADATSLIDEGSFCKEVIVFGPSKNKASISWYSNPFYSNNILIELYRVSAAIPNFFLPANNTHACTMIVGKLELFNETTTSGYKEHPCFHFGSADQQLTVRFENYHLGVKATLQVLNERAHLGPFVVTLTFFNEKNIIIRNDLVNKFVISQGQNAFSHSFLTYHDQLNYFKMYNALYYKVVLEPLNDHSFGFV